MSEDIHNLPTVEEITAVVPGEASSNVGVNRDIIVCLQGGGLHCISNLHPSYLPLHYVLDSWMRQLESNVRNCIIML